MSFLLDHDPTVLKSPRAIREASKNGRKEVVRMLLDAGLDPCVQVRVGADGVRVRVSLGAGGFVGPHPPLRTHPPS